MLAEPFTDNPIFISLQAMLEKKKLYSQWFVDAFGDMKPFFPQFDDLTVRQLIIDRICWPYLCLKKKNTSRVCWYIFYSSFP
jgi:hypothetical protein